MAQWVAFLNTVDPEGTDPHRSLRLQRERIGLAAVRPDQLLLPGAAGLALHASPIRSGPTSPTALPNFLRAARFVNSLDQREGAVPADPPLRRLLVCHLHGPSLQADRDAACTTWLARSDRRDAGPQAGLRRAEPERVDQGRLLRPERRRDAVLLEVPDQPRRLRRRHRDAPAATTLNPHNGDVTNAGDAAAGQLQALRRHGAKLVPVAGLGHRLPDRQSVRAGSRPPTPSAYQGSLSTVGQAQDALAVGHARPGRQRRRVDRHDHRPRRSASRARGSGGACTAGCRTPPPTRCGSPPSASSLRTTRSSPHVPVAGLPHRIHRLSARRLHGPAPGDSSDAAKESNLPSRGLPGPASFEDWMGHQARAAPGRMLRRGCRWRFGWWLPSKAGLRGGLLFAPHTGELR